MVVAFIASTGSLEESLVRLAVPPPYYYLCRRSCSSKSNRWLPGLPALPLLFMALRFAAAASPLDPLLSANGASAD